MKELLRTISNTISRLFSKGSTPREKKAPAETLPPTRQSDKKSGKKKRKKKKWSLDSWIVEEKEGAQRFHDFPISLKVMRAISDLNFTYCTPIQALALDHSLAGKDLVAKANTGTGKTAVFLITIIHRLLQEKRKGPGYARALVLAPTRELVMQIGKDAHQLAKYSQVTIRTVFGGTDYQKQQDILQSKPCDLLIATPGRLLDFLGKNIINLDYASILVLDEADRMLDMGFIPDVRRIVGRLPKKEKRQTMLFSATITDDVRRLASQWCHTPSMVEAEPEHMTAEKMKQVVYLASSEEKFHILCNLIIRHPDRRVMVFTNMKGESSKLCDKLQKVGISCLLLTGDVPQQKRMTRLENFRSGKTRVLVATDVVGRGIHIDDIELVVNFTLPYEPEDYIHRIGRTGRAGAEGLAVSFACEEGAFYLPAIEELLGEKLDCVLPEEELLHSIPLSKPAPTPHKKKRRRRSSAKRSSYKRKERAEKQ